MTRKNNNRTENKNTRNNTRKAAEQQQDLFVHVETDARIEPAKKSATDLAHEKAEKEAEKEAKRKAAEAARERDRECTKNFAAVTMTPNDAFRDVNAHKDERIHEDGTTVASFLAEKGLTKLNFKSLKAALPAEFVDADGCVCMPTVKAAVYDGVAEDIKAGKPVYYFVTSKRNGETKRTYKKAQTYGFSRIDLWTPAVILRLLKAALTYSERKEHYAKRNAEVKAAKQFYVVNELTDTAMSTKVADKATRVTTYTRIDSANVKWAE
jgi:hypothetical protein